MWVDDCRTRRDATPGYPARKVVFGGWQGEDRLYVLAQDAKSLQSSGSTAGRVTGVIASCALPAGRCSSIVNLKRTQTVVFAYGAPPSAEPLEAAGKTSYEVVVSAAATYDVPREVIRGGRNSHQFV